MRLLSLNCRGLRNPETVSELRLLVKKKASQVVFLSETRLDVKSVEWLRIQLGMRSALGVQKDGYGAGLPLLWTQDTDLSIASYFRNHIDVVVRSSDDVQWRFTGFYGNPEAHRRIDSWNLLRYLAQSNSLPWLVRGDFNEIVDFGEKLGIHDRPQWQMRNFRNALSDCELSDLGFQGPKYTWCNMQGYPDIVFALLDRGVSNAEWRLLLLEASVRNLQFVFSDHHAVIVDFEARTMGNFPKKHLFRFQAAWISRAGCEDVIREAWASTHTGTLMFQLCQKVKACRMALIQWNKLDVNSLTHQIKKARETLATYDANLQSSWNDPEIMRDRCAKRKSLNFLLTQEETYWRQRSRISWMKEGDRNTRYFHAFATQRKQKNRISCLLNRHDNWVTQEDELGNLAKDFFKNLFNTSNPTSTDQVVDLIDRFITEDMNQWLLREFDALEVRDALFQMPPTKAPGPNGMSAIFFQTYWHIVGNDFTLDFLDFLNSGCMLRSVNFTHIALIPKTKLPESMGQFRPIALCNVFYKTISKVLANRLKVILPSIILDSQASLFQGG